MPSNSDNTMARMSKEWRTVYDARVKPLGVSQTQLSRHLAKLLMRISESDLRKLVDKPKKKTLTVPSPPLKGDFVRRPLRRSKRGVMDAATLPFVILIGAILLLVFVALSYSLLTPLQDLQEAGDVEGSAVSRISDGISGIPGMVNALFIFGIFALGASTILLSYFTPTHMVFAPVILVVLILGAYFGAYISNAWEAMDQAADGLMRQSLDSQTGMRVIMGNLVEYFIAIAVLSGFAFWGGTKRSSGNEAANTGGFG